MYIVVVCLDSLIVSVIVHLLFAEQVKHDASERVLIVERAPNSKTAVISCCVCMILVNLTLVWPYYDGLACIPKSQMA